MKSLFRHGRSPFFLLLASSFGLVAAKILSDAENRTGRFDFDDGSGRIWSQNHSVALRRSAPSRRGRSARPSA